MILPTYPKYKPSGVEWLGEVPEKWSFERLNVVALLKDDLSSNKIGKLLYRHFEESDAEIQKHFIAIFLAEVRPAGWYDQLLAHLNRLHPSSFYLGSLLGTFETQITLGFLVDKEEGQLKQLAGAVLAKRRYASKTLTNRTEAIPANTMLCDENKLPIDQLLAKHDPSSPEEFGKQLEIKKGKPGR